MNYTKFSQSFLARLGPGLLYAGAAVGVSHLVQSTRAGGMFGFELIFAILIIHFIKYPFFEFGPRYTAATGRNILHGYAALGKWAVWAYLIMTLSTMFIIQATVTVVTAGLFAHISGFEVLGGCDPQVTAAIISSLLLLICFILLSSGHYVLLEKLIKIIILLLSFTTIFAVVALLFDNPGHESEVVHFSLSEATHLLFLVTLLGWMPAPIELSVWHSIWAQSNNESAGKVTGMKEALFDFRVGFFGTALLAICFLTLGALVMHGSGKTFDSDGVRFAEQLLAMYEEALGSWAYPVVALAALTAMFTTVLTLLDAFPRSIVMSLELLFPQRIKHQKNGIIYLTWLLITVIGAIIILFFFLPSMEEMVKVATVVAFVAAPVLATLNTLAMFDKTIPQQHRPGKWMLIWCLLGLTALIGCSTGYLFLL